MIARVTKQLQIPRRELSCPRRRNPRLENRVHTPHWREDPPRRWGSVERRGLECHWMPCLYRIVWAAFCPDPDPLDEPRPGVGANFDRDAAQGHATTHCSRRPGPAARNPGSPGRSAPRCGCCSGPRTRRCAAPQTPRSRARCTRPCRRSAGSQSSVSTRALQKY